jgi:hypothetical protein
MEQTVPIIRFACPHFFRRLIGKFGRFVRILIMLCLELILIRIKWISTTQTAGLIGAVRLEL